jgi:hypothetical protein
MHLGDSQLYHRCIEKSSRFFGRFTAVLKLRERLQFGSRERPGQQLFPFFVFIHICCRNSRRVGGKCMYINIGIVIKALSSTLNSGSDRNHQSFSKFCTS